MPFAPATFWAVNVILDGKDYPRLPRFIGSWNGPGRIIADGTYRSAITLTEYGIERSTLSPGDHKLALKIGDEKSHELTFNIRAEKPKLSLKIEADRAVVSPGKKVNLTIAIRNLDTARISLPWIYGATRVILNGKDKGLMAF